MGFGDDKAEIVEDVAETLPRGGNDDAESDGEGALTTTRNWSRSFGGGRALRSVGAFVGRS
jgi:hypothetical protein